MINSESPQNSKLKNYKETVNKVFEIINTPKSISSKIFVDLCDYKITYLVINTQNNNNCNWSLCGFSTNNKNQVNTIFEKSLIDCDQVKSIKLLYIKLNKIEKYQSVSVAVKFLNGYLEYHKTTLNNMFSKFLAVA